MLFIKTKPNYCLKITLAFFRIVFFSCLVPSFFSCNHWEKDKTSFRIALASANVKFPFEVASKINKKIQWDVRIIPEISQRLNLIESGEIDAFEWDIISLYKATVENKSPNFIALFPINSRYSMFVKPNLNFTNSTNNDEIVVGVDQFSIHAFLVDYWLKKKIKNAEVLANNEQMIQRLKDDAIQTAVLLDTDSTRKKLNNYTIFSSTYPKGPALSVLVVLRTMDNNYIKDIFLNYQQIIQKKEKICRKIIQNYPRKEKKQMWSLLQNECLEKLPNNLYFSEDLFNKIQTWIRLHEPTSSEAPPYQHFFWLDTSEK